MVQLNSSFDNPTCAENGLRRPAFKGWSIGRGFGKSHRDWTTDPSLPRFGRFTPKGNGYYRANAFWRTKLEQPPQAGLGTAYRGTDDKGKPWHIDPGTYGDVGPLVCKVKRDAKKGIKLKPRFPRPEEKYAAAATPGPKYDISGMTADARGSRSAVCQSRTVLRSQKDEDPGPGQYETRCKAGANYPIKHGTLYDITMKGRDMPPREADTPRRQRRSPGPGSHDLKAFSDKYNIVPMTWMPPFMKEIAEMEAHEAGAASAGGHGGLGASHTGSSLGALRGNDTTQSCPDMFRIAQGSPLIN